MIAIPLIDELRDIRRRLAEEQKLDVERYAAMLGKVADTTPGRYVDSPLMPNGLRSAGTPVKSAG